MFRSSLGTRVSHGTLCPSVCHGNVLVMGCALLHQGLVMAEPSWIKGGSLHGPSQNKGWSWQGTSCVKIWSWYCNMVPNYGHENVTLVHSVGHCIIFLDKGLFIAGAIFAQGCVIALHILPHMLVMSMPYLASCWLWKVTSCTNGVSLHSKFGSHVGNGNCTFGTLVYCYIAILLKGYMTIWL